MNVLWEAVIWRASVYSDINHLSTSIDLIHNCVVNHAYFSLPFPSSTTFQSSSSSSNSNLGPGGWLPNLTQYFSLTRQCCIGMEYRGLQHNKLGIVCLDEAMSPFMAAAYLWLRRVDVYHISCRVRDLRSWLCSSIYRLRWLGITLALAFCKMKALKQFDVA